MSYLAQLRTFVEVYRSGSISRAANHLNLSQPAASAHIQSLEQLAGQKLFIRKPRGVVATPAAQELAQQVSVHFDAIERKLASVHKKNRQIEGTIHIAGPAEYISYVASAQLANLLQAGEVNVNIYPGNRQQIYQRLDNGEADLAITASRPDPERFEYKILDSEKLILVANPFVAKNILRQGLSAQTLNEFPVVSYDSQKPLIRDYFNQVFASECESQVAAICPDIRALAGLVQAGLGYTVLPDYLCHEAIKNGNLAALGGAGPENLIYLVWRKGALSHPRIHYAQDVLMAFSHLNSQRFNGLE
ncbi:LysR family transcriptional regulator [Gayadomonas joobiniege]|uniref:LysR family transcriptional regulator n=1 Tax=Gayadomonas joobiniege TaxID=1234606 RepID=UPI00035D5A36|nr:LysR family transcriptional regulator [Gayadomonas joobiniege]